MFGLNSLLAILVALAERFFALMATFFGLSNFLG